MTYDAYITYLAGECGAECRECGGPVGEDEICCECGEFNQLYPDPDAGRD